MNNGLRPRGVSMAKFALLPVLLAAGCLISGVYGALHDQISYTVSPEYFHAFKFRQFAIPPELQNRLVRRSWDGKPRGGWAWSSACPCCSSD